MPRLPTLLLPTLLLPTLLPAQGRPDAGPAVAAVPVVDVVDDDLLLERIEANCEVLRAAGSLHTLAALRQRAGKGPLALTLAPVAAVPASPVELHQRLLRSVCVVGHYYPCAECKAWHFSASTGFALGSQGQLATCWHLLADDPAQPGACLCAADWQGRVVPITAVLAGDPAADLAILQCPWQDLVPLPLRAEVRTGERVYCLSNPDHLFASFTEGLVARRYVVRGDAPGAEPAPAPRPGEHGRRGRPDLRRTTLLQVTCEFALGSSGAPIVDAAGNVVGIAQSTSTLLADAEAAAPETQMVARSAVPAAALRQLVGR